MKPPDCVVPAPARIISTGPPLVCGVAVRCATWLLSALSRQVTVVVPVAVTWASAVIRNCLLGLALTVRLGVPPVAPVAMKPPPVAPVAPVAPAAPVAPVGPVAPVAPVAPVGPGPPVAPVVPVA